VVLNSPESFEAVIVELTTAGSIVHRQMDRKSPWWITFVQTKAELVQVVEDVSQTEGDVIIWVAYPKKSSKKYVCELDRDHGFEILGTVGFEGVRQVAIDADWSALRFRRVEYVAKMTRDPQRAITKVGKEHVNSGKK
jgi:hypothetical protein